jgi:putative glutamine amidotransferase
MKPRIGVTTSRRGGWRSLLMNRLALWRVGAKGLGLRPGDAATLEGLSGLIIGGGDDIGAELYGGTPIPDVRIDPDRDKLELALLEKALAADMPVLGICRGAQILNVYLGGTLHSDIHEIYHEIYEAAPKMRTVLPRKVITLVEDSNLARILSCNPCRVNALHHQSIDTLGKGLRVVGHDEAGVIQAVETAGAGFIIGVQWHPELLVFSRPQQRLFRALAAAARDWGSSGKESFSTAGRTKAQAVADT